MESFANLRENLAEIGLDLDDHPAGPPVQQARPLEHPRGRGAERDAEPRGRSRFFEASAANGPGVFETLKGISKLTLRALRSRMTGDVRRPAVFAAPATPRDPGRLVRVLRAPARPPSGVLPVPGARSRTAPPSSATLDRLSKFSEMTRPQAPRKPRGPRPPPPRSPMPRRRRRPARPSPSPPQSRRLAPRGRPPPRSASASPPAPPPTPAEPAVKHVKVRSSVDILSELDKLRNSRLRRPPPADPGPPLRCRPPPLRGRLD